MMSHVGQLVVYWQTKEARVLLACFTFKKLLDYRNTRVAKREEDSSEVDGGT